MTLPLLTQNQEALLRALESGDLRAASPGEEGVWTVHSDVKTQILELFREGVLTTFSEWPGFVDKHTLKPRTFGLLEGIRCVPGGTSVRRGAYVAPGVIIMPPSYINIGAYIGEGTMVDSHVLVGSCAQIGKNVHLSAGVQIGGVLEPALASPVILEDDVFVGAGAVIVEGLLIQKGAILAPHVSLSKGVEVYDLVSEKILPKGAPIPAGAIVIPGSRPVTSAWGKAQGLHKYCALIVKYRDAGTSAAVALEQALR